jgi:hypothetical protein
MTTFGPKQLGRCLGCQTDCYEVREVWPGGHALAGEPRRLGRQRECGTQLDFLLSDGSRAAVTVCQDCAAAIGPADFSAIWRACVARQDVALALAERSPTVRRQAWAQSAAVFPLARLGRRRESPDGLLMMDRR